MEMNERPQSQRDVEAPDRKADMKVSTLILSDNAFGGAEEGICASCLRIFITGLCSFLMCVLPCLWCCYVKVFEQYERAVHFRLGKVQRPAKGPGIFFFVPCIDSWRTVDMRICTIDVPPQNMMTKDSVTCHVNAVVYFYISDAIKAVTCVENFAGSTGLLAQTSLRSVIGDSELDDLLQKREIINRKLTKILDDATEEWGIQVVTVEISDVTLPAEMQRSIASQAEAERERRAKVISADGELQASSHLLEAANNMTKNSATIQLRYLQTLTQISAEKPSTIFFPLPLSFKETMPWNMDRKEQGGGGSDARSAPSAPVGSPLDVVVSNIRQAAAS